MSNETQAQFTAAHEAEMAEFFAVDVVPTETPVDQSEVPAETGGKFSSKTKFRGVFLNKPDSTSKKRYRVAIAQQANRNSGTFWLNLGNFDCINVAAQAYNVAALGIFLGAAKLNRVNLSECGQEELAQFKKDRALRISMAGLVMQAVKNAGEELNYLPDSE